MKPGKRKSTSLSFFAPILILLLTKFTTTSSNISTLENPQLNQVTDVIFCSSTSTSTSIIPLEDNKNQRHLLNWNLNTIAKDINSFGLYSAMKNVSKCLELYASNSRRISSNKGQSFVLPAVDLSSHFIHFLFMPRDLEEVKFVIHQLTNFQEEWRKNTQNIWTPIALIILPNEQDKKSEQNNDQNRADLTSSLTSENYQTQIPLDSQIFLVFLPSYQNATEKAPSASVWEIYHANSHLITNKLEEFSFLVFSKNYEGGRTQISVIQEILSKISFLGNFGSRRKFHGTRIKAAGVFQEAELFNVNLERLNETHVKFLGGFAFSILRDLRDSLHFTVEERWGDYYIRDARIDGIGRQVLDGTIDIAITPLTNLPYRGKKLHFLPSIQSESIHVYFQQPENFAFQNIFTFPFSKSVWWALTFSGITLTFSIVLIGFGSRRRKLEEDVKMSLFDLIFESISMLLFQSVPSANASASVYVTSLTSVTSFSGRKIVILMGFFQGVILLSIYSGSIISALTVKLNPVSSVEHLLQYGYLFLADTMILSYYTAAKEGGQASKVIEDTAKYFKSEEDNFQKILGPSGNHGNGDLQFYALVIETHQLLYKAKRLNYTESQVCSPSHLIFETSKGMSMFLKKRSPFKEFFSIKTMLLIERGLNHLHNERSRENMVPSCKASAKYKSTLATSLPQVRLRDSSFAFKIIGFGCIASFFMVVLEILHKNSAYCREKLKLRQK